MFPLTFWSVVVVFCFRRFVAHKPHFPFERLDLYTAAPYAWCSIFAIVQLSFSAQCSSSSSSAASFCTLCTSLSDCVQLRLILKPSLLGFCSCHQSLHFFSGDLQFSERVLIRFELAQCRGGGRAGPWNKAWLCCNSRPSDIFFNYWFVMRPAGIVGSCILYVPFQHFPVWFWHHVKWNGIIWRGDNKFSLSLLGKRHSVSVNTLSCVCLHLSISLTLLLTDQSLITRLRSSHAAGQRAVNTKHWSKRQSPSFRPLPCSCLLPFNHSSVMSACLNLHQKKRMRKVVGMTAGHVRCSSGDWHTGPLCGCVEGGPFPPLLLIHTLEAPIQPGSGWGEVGALL